MMSLDKGTTKYFRLFVETVLSLLKQSTYFTVFAEKNVSYDVPWSCRKMFCLFPKQEERFAATLGLDKFLFYSTCKQCSSFRSNMASFVLFAYLFATIYFLFCHLVKN